jgi:hypothetical protein
MRAAATGHWNSITREPPWLQQSFQLRLRSLPGCIAGKPVTSKAAARRALLLESADLQYPFPFSWVDPVLFRAAIFSAVSIMQGNSLGPVSEIFTSKVSMN